MTRAPYPPPVHMLHQLGIAFDPPADGRVSLRLPITPDLCSATGALRPGVAATLIDVAGGRLSVPAVAPDWVATADLSVSMTGRVDRGSLVAHGHIVRAGRTAVVVEVDLEDDLGARVGSGSMSFTVLPRRDTNLRLEEVEPGLVAWGASRQPDIAYLDFAGVEVVDSAAGIVQIACDPKVRNSFQALQGGMVCTLADIAAETAGSMALQRPAATVSLETWFLAPGKVGPVRATGRLLVADSERARAVVRVELRDLGTDDRLVSVTLATVSAGTVSR